MLYTLNQLSGANIASQSYVNLQISNLINSSSDLLNTLLELAAAIINDSAFSVTMTNLIGTKVGLTSNNTISGANTFSGTNTFSGSNTFSSANTFLRSNTFNSTSGNIIDRLYSTISINNGNTRRNVANYFEVGMGQTPYIYYDNAGKFGSINTNDSSLNWNIALNSVFNINAINSVNENISGTAIINNLYSYGWSRKLLNSQTPKLFGERLDAINIFRARKLPSWLFFLE